MNFEAAKLGRNDKKYQKRIENRTTDITHREHFNLF